MQQSPHQNPQTMGGLHPNELKIILVDPKKVEFTPYHKIPHLIGPVINDPNESQETRDAAEKYLVDDQGKAIARQIHDERKCR